MTDPTILPDPPEPPRIRALRRLVTALTLTLIFGMLVIVGLFIWRLAPGAKAPNLPSDITLPQGETLTGYAQNPDWTVLITTDTAGVQRLHLLRAGSETIHQTTQIRTAD